MKNLKTLGWVADKGEGSAWRILFSKNEIGAVCYDMIGLDTEITANLISAAPEMLSALELCLPYIQDAEDENFDDIDAGIHKDQNLVQCLKMVKFAISKATGKTHNQKKVNNDISRA